MKKKIFLLILLFILLITCFFFVILNRKDNNYLTLYGNIEIRQIDLSFQVGGRLAKLFKEEGDTVKAGELVGLIDPRDYSINYAKSTAEVERLQAVKDDAYDKYTRNTPLNNAGAISEQNYKTIINNKNRTKAEYDMAVAGKNYAKNQLDYTKLYAPEDGIIMVRVVEPGSTVMKGQPVYTMAKIHPVWVRAYINEKDLGNIKYGQKVEVSTDTIDPKTGKHRTYKGYIGYISPVAEFTPKTVQTTDIRTTLVYRIRVYIDDVDEFLRQGMPVTIKVNLISDGNNKKMEN